MKTLLKVFVLITAMLSLTVAAQRSQEFGDYTVHYNALNSSMLTPGIAKAYGITRSGSRALINISVLKSHDDEPASAVAAIVVTTGRNLTGQTREVKMREINDGDGAIYYIGQLSVRNMETFDFTVMVTPQGRNEAFSVKFRQQFYTE